MHAAQYVVKLVKGNCTFTIVQNVLRSMSAIRTENSSAFERYLSVFIVPHNEVFL
jgi:hypothetical protein